MQTRTTPPIHRLTTARLKALLRNVLIALALLIGSAQLSSAAVSVMATDDDGVLVAAKKNPADQVASSIQINSATAAVSLTVSGPVIWFVDSIAPAGGNDTWTGPNLKALQTVTQAAALDAANHRIFLLNNSGSSISALAC